MFGLCQIFEINTIVQKMNTRYTIRKMVLVQKLKKCVQHIQKKNILINKKNTKVLLYTKLIQHVRGDFAKKNLLYKI